MGLLKKTKTTNSLRGDFNRVLQKSQDTPVVVQFFATWCGPCKIIKPVMKDLVSKSNGKWLLVFVDVEKNQQLASTYSVRSIPDVRMFYKGEVIASFTGGRSSQLIQTWLNANLPKRRRKSQFPELEKLIKTGDTQSATMYLLHQLNEQNPKSPIAKLLLALQSVGKNNPLAMGLLQKIDKKGEFGSIARQILDIIDFDVDDQDAHTPTSSPFDPRIRNVESIIDLKSFDAGLLSRLVHNYINEVRRKHGAKPLNEHAILASAAKDHNLYQIKHDVLTHEQRTQNKRNVKNRVDSFGGSFRLVGENVQYQGMQIMRSGNRTKVITDSYVNTAKKLVKNWVNSPGHFKNMVNPQFTYSGLAIGWNPENHAIFATQVFGA